MAANPSPCRFCGAPLREQVLDLGRHPLSNAYLTADDLAGEESRYPDHWT